jgi:hypothetical protein
MRTGRAQLWRFVLVSRFAGFGFLHYVATGKLRDFYGLTDEEPMLLV